MDSLNRSYRSRKPRGYAIDEGYGFGKRKASGAKDSDTVLRDATQFTPQASRQPPAAVSPEETWRPKGLPADFEPAGTLSAEASPAGKRSGGGSASPSPAAKRRRKAPAAPSQRQLTLFELNERANSPGKATRSVKIALRQAERNLGDGKVPNPKLVGEATEIMGRIKADLEIKDAQYGRGLFATNGFKEGDILTRYDGTRRVVSDPGLEKMPKTHMLRIPQSQNIIDGRPLSLRLERAGDHSGRWWPRLTKDWEAGYGALANSAVTAVANARMIFLPDETAVNRPAGEKKIPKALLDVLPRVPFLVAKRDIAPGEEVLWHYQVALDNYEPN